MEELVFEMLRKRNLINEEETVAYNEVNIINNEVIIKGNKLGLIQLAEYFVQIAVSDIANHHVHLDSNNYFDNANCEMIIVKE